MSNQSKLLKYVLVGIFGGADQNNMQHVIDAGMTSFGRPSYDWLWGAASKYFKKTGKVLTKKIFEYRLAQSKLDEDIKHLYLEDCKGLFSNKLYRRVVNGDLVSFSVAELMAYRRSQQFVDMSQSYMTAVSSGELEIDDALHKLYRSMTPLVTKQRGPEYEIIHYAEEFEERQKQRKEEYEAELRGDILRYKWPYREFQSVIGSVPPGTVTLIAANTGVGKSISVNDIAVSAAGQGLGVIIIKSENTRRQVTARLDSRLTRERYNVIKGYGFENEQQLNDFNRRWSEKLSTAQNIKIIKMPPTGFTAATIMRAIYQLKEEDPDFVPKVLIIDSPDLMKPSIDIPVYGDSATRVSATAVYWEVKALTEDNDFITFATAQMNRKSKEAGANVDVEGIGDDYNKARIVDMFLILFETLELVLENKIGIRVGKNRDGPKPAHPLFLFADKATMSFYDLEDTVDEEDTERKVAEIKKLSTRGPKRNRKRIKLKPRVKGPRMITDSDDYEEAYG